MFSISFLQIQFKIIDGICINLYLYFLPLGLSLQKTNKKTSFYIQAFFNTQLINVRFVICSRCMYSRECQIGMQGPQLFPEPGHFCKLDVATSRIAFLDHFKFKQLRALCSTKLHLWHPLMYRLSRTSRNVETFLIFALSLKSWSALATVILGNQNCQINIVVFLQIQIKIGDCICIMHSI